MPDNANPAKPNLWRILRLRAPEAVEAALARPSERATIALAALTTAFGLALETQASLGARPDAALLATLLAAGAAFGVAALYVDGWIVDRVAHVFCGRGSSRAARAALGWGPAPLALFTLAALVAEIFAPGATAGLAAAALSLAIALWSIVRCTAMLGRTHALARWRAFASIIVAPLALAVAVAMAIRTFAFQPFAVASGSMAPALFVGDDVFVAKYAYGYVRQSFPFGLAPYEGRLFGRPPRRGDVIAFVQAPDGAVYLKRVVGLPGDRVQLVGARLAINGKMVERRPLAPLSLTDAFGAPSAIATYEETLPEGARYVIAQAQGDTGLLSSTPVYLVPPDSAFVLGDNRDNSLDSRVSLADNGIGFVPFDTIVGRASLIYFSVDRDRPAADRAPRWDRIGAFVR